TGIGLALVKELVHLHGGHITVMSVENAGTTFTISIPTGKSHLPADRIDVAHTMTSTALGAQPYVQEVVSWLSEEIHPSTVVGNSQFIAQDFSTVASTADSRIAPSPEFHILLVDDNTDMRQYLERLLLQSKYKVSAVTNGLEALHSVRQHIPDLVLTDVMMPGLDGFELLRELRANPSTTMVPVIILSARAGEESRVEGLEAGADDYLIKPFSARELLARVRAHLEIAHIRHETQKALKYRSAQYETLLNQAPIGVYLVDADFRIREVNPAALPVFGDITDLIGRDLSEVMHILWNQKYADEVVGIFLHTLKTG